MPPFSELQRNISYKNYITDFLISFIIVYLSSSFIYFPLFIGLFITLNLRLSLVIPFLLFTEITHNFIPFSLITFFFIYKLYIYPTLFIKFSKDYINIISMFLIYVLYFSLLVSINIIFDTPFNFNIIYLIYYGFIELLLFKVLKWNLKLS